MPASVHPPVVDAAAATEDANAAQAAAAHAAAEHAAAARFAAIEIAATADDTPASIAAAADGIAAASSSSGLPKAAPSRAGGANPDPHPAERAAAMLEYFMTLYSPWLSAWAFAYRAEALGCDAPQPASSAPHIVRAACSP